MSRGKCLLIREHVKLLAVVLFAMAAGAACQHQYLMQIRQEGSRREIQIETIQIGAVQERIEAEPYTYEVTEMTPEDIAEEEYYDSLELLAICVEAEAGNQDLTGKRMVADVIFNRVDDPDFPDTITEVITQKNQFSSYWDGGMDRVVEPSEETFLAVRMELEERSWPGLLYFTAGDWPAYGTPWKKIGDHYFSTK